MYLKAIANLHLNLSEKAVLLSEELKKSIDGSFQDDQIRFFYHIQGRAALRRGQYNQAIECFQKALHHQCNQHSFEFSRDMHAWFYDDLARAYIKKEQLDEAVQLYEKIITLTTGRLYFGDVYAKSFYCLGKIYQQMGWEGKAIDYYEQFLKIWEKADKDLPELMDAKKQLVSLKNKSS
jgi:tetratricopeptide (TPR) repeat protein